MGEVVAVFIPEFGAHGEGHGGEYGSFAVGDLALQYLGDAVVIFAGFIKGEFVIDPEADEKGDGHAYGQSPDIDDGGKAVFKQVAEGEFEPGFEHVVEFMT